MCVSSAKKLAWFLLSMSRRLVELDHFPLYSGCYSYFGWDWKLLGSEENGRREGRRRYFEGANQLFSDDDDYAKFYIQKLCKLIFLIFLFEF